MHMKKRLALAALAALVVMLAAAPSFADEATGGGLTVGVTYWPAQADVATLNATGAGVTTTSATDSYNGWIFNGSYRLRHNWQVGAEYSTNSHAYSAGTITYSELRPHLKYFFSDGEKGAFGAGIHYNTINVSGPYGSGSWSGLGISAEGRAPLGGKTSLYGLVDYTPSYTGALSYSVFSTKATSSVCAEAGLKHRFSDAFSARLGWRASRRNATTTVTAPTYTREVSDTFTLRGLVVGLDYRF